MVVSSFTSAESLDDVKRSDSGLSSGSKGSYASDENNNLVDKIDLDEYRIR